MTTRGNRKHIRGVVEIPTKVKVMDRAKTKLWSGNGTIVNIGGGGILLELTQMEEQIVRKLVEKEYILQLTFALANFWLQLRVAAEVTRIETAEEEGAKRQRFGVVFKGLHKNRERRIADYTEKFAISELVDIAFQKAIKNSKKNINKKEDNNDKGRRRTQ